MKLFAAVAAAVLFAVPAFAQQVVTPETTTGVYMSAADVAAAVGKLPKNPLASVPVFKMGPFNVNVEHRLGAPAAAQAASVHDKDAELFYMIGGTSKKMSKGDFMLVPAGVPHWFTDISGQITEFSLHLPVK